MNAEIEKMFKNKRCVLLGAGVSNMPLAKMLTDCGAALEVRDKKTEEQMGDRAAALREMGAGLVLGEQYLDNIRGDYVFRSPGFRPDMPALESARENGCTVTAEMDLFLELSPCPVIGVTGSDGKSTTTTLISKILEAENKPGRRVFLGGNIGEPLLHRMGDMKKDDIAAAELSSFQLMSVSSPIAVAVIKNVTPNHLNWHTDMEEYISAKARILNGCGLAVLNYDDSVCRDLGEKCASPVMWFSRKEIPLEFLKKYEGGVYPKGGDIVCFTVASGTEETVMRRDDIKLCGEHIMENFCTAIAATRSFASNAACVSVARTFGGVPHRMELVREVGGVRYYNSSIDSSPSRTAATVAAMDRPVRIICGGYDKNIPYEPLAECLSDGKVKTVVLTGATIEKMKAVFEADEKFCKSGVHVEICPDFRDAVLYAAHSAEQGDAVLLSPAAASFDAFENFEKRGECFRKIVEEIK